MFQYRKRYEVTCDVFKNVETAEAVQFQYRKRYEVTCDASSSARTPTALKRFQYRKRYEVTCDQGMFMPDLLAFLRFNTASGMRSHVTFDVVPVERDCAGFNTASGMRSHVTCE